MYQPPSCLLLPHSHGERGCCVRLEGLGMEGSRTKLAGKFCTWCTVVFSGDLESPPEATPPIEDSTCGWVSSVAWSSRRAFMLGIVGMNKFSFSRIFNMHIIVCWKALTLSGALCKLCRSVWHKWIIFSVRLWWVKQSNRLGPLNNLLSLG